MINPLLLIGFALLLGVSPKDNPSVKRVERVGIATNFEENAVVYKEELSKVFAGNKVTVQAVYKSDQTSFAKKEISWNVDGPLRYEYFNHLKGYSEGISKIGNNAYTVYSESDAKRKETTLEIDGTVVYDEYLVAWTQENLADIISGKEPSLKIIVPRRLDYYSFIAKGKKDQNGVYNIEIEADNFFLRQVIQPIKLRFSADKELLSIKAMSYIHPEENDLQPIIVNYQ